jgi:hypothetical protein
MLNIFIPLGITSKNSGCNWLRGLGPLLPLLFPLAFRGVLKRGLNGLGFAVFGTFLRDEKLLLLILP